MKAVILWIVALLLTVAAAIYQRSTGPTYPVRGTVTIDNEVIKYKLLRSDIVQGDKPTEIKIEVKNTEITGDYTYRRYKSYDDWTKKPLRREGNFLILEMPRQPMAGKIEYSVQLAKGLKTYNLTKELVVMRYKGDVPDFILWPHILFMFSAMLFSTRAGIAAIFREKSTLTISFWTFILLIPGGLILGPIVQKYAFDAYWTGWPFGHDLTDNKTIVGFAFWVFAWYQLRKNSKKYIWPIIASIVLLIVFSIPHSALGSEIDHRKQQTEETK